MMVVEGENHRVFSRIRETLFLIILAIFIHIEVILFPIKAIFNHNMIYFIIQWFVFILVQVVPLGDLSNQNFIDLNFLLTASQFEMGGFVSIAHKHYLNHLVALIFPLLLILFLQLSLIQLFIKQVKHLDILNKPFPYINVNHGLPILIMLSFILFL